MQGIIFLLIGIFFGITMTKSEALSWFRIYEMFRFESFHMYGIIGTAVILGAIIISIMKILKVRVAGGGVVVYNSLPLNMKRHLISGTIFGLGWALVGACPGPMFVLAGNGYFFILVVIAGAVFGTYTYGLIRNKLPH
ncbi:MAG: YeeE/YedE family protein [Bacteroidetes bacterium]|nr:YeeE/YedE family protein [Bacteroidota bacterium]